MAMLDVQDAWGGYGGADILKGAELSVAAGEMTVIIGPNGAGKSTLMKAIFGLIHLRRGTVALEGAAITGRPADKLVPMGLAYVPQERNVFPSLTVAENLDLGAYIRRKPDSAARERIFTTFPELAERRRQAAGTLSGGQRQMVAMGRALMLSPRLLMLDEPTAGLSPRLIETMFARIREINAQGTTVLMVEQNARLALKFADKGVVMVAGRKRHERPGAQMLDDPEIAEMFLGG